MHEKSLEKQSWMEMSAVQIGGAICMPMILIGFELSRLNSVKALLAICIGNLFLFLLAFLTAEMSYRAKATTAENASHYFGKVGKCFFALILTLSMCGWFAIQAEVMAKDLGGGRYTAVVISCAIVLATLKGIRAVTKLANVALPLMLITLLCCLVMAFVNRQEVVQSSEGTLFQGVSLVIAAAILAVIDLPTFFRHARSKSDARKASIATFLIGMPLVELVGVLLGLWTTAPDVSQALACFGHVAWKGWIWLFILLVGWTTNNANLYSASVSLQTLLPQLSIKKAILLAGLMAVILAGCDLLSRLTFVLEIMGVSVASMGAVVLTAYFLKRHHVVLQSLAWLLGATWGLLHVHAVVKITPIAIVDAALISAISTLFIWRCGSEKRIAH